MSSPTKLEENRKNIRIHDSIVRRPISRSSSAVNRNFSRKTTVTNVDSKGAAAADELAEQTGTFFTKHMSLMRTRNVTRSSAVNNSPTTLKRGVFTSMSLLPKSGNAACNTRDLQQRFAERVELLNAQRCLTNYMTKVTVLENENKILQREVSSLKKTIHRNCRRPNPTHRNHNVNNLRRYLREADSAKTDIDIQLAELTEYIRDMQLKLAIDKDQLVKSSPENNLTSQAKGNGKKRWISCVKRCLSFEEMEISHLKEEVKKLNEQLNEQILKHIETVNESRCICDQLDFFQKLFDSKSGKTAELVTSEVPSEPPLFAVKCNQQPTEDSCSSERLSNLKISHELVSVLLKKNSEAKEVIQNLKATIVDEEINSKDKKQLLFGMLNKLHGDVECLLNSVEKESNEEKFAENPEVLNGTEPVAITNLNIPTGNGAEAESGESHPQSTDCPINVESKEVPCPEEIESPSEVLATVSSEDNQENRVIVPSTEQSASIQNEIFTKLEDMTVSTSMDSVANVIDNGQGGHFIEHVKHFKLLTPSRSDYSAGPIKHSYYSFSPASSQGTKNSQNSSSTRVDCNIISPNFEKLTSNSPSISGADAESIKFTTNSLRDHEQRFSSNKCSSLHLSKSNLFEGVHLRLKEEDKQIYNEPTQNVLGEFFSSRKESAASKPVSHFTYHSTAAAKTSHCVNQTDLPLVLHACEDGRLIFVQNLSDQKVNLGGMSIVRDMGYGRRKIRYILPDPSYVEAKGRNNIFKIWSHGCRPEGSEGLELEEGAWGKGKDIHTSLWDAHGRFVTRVEA